MIKRWTLFLLTALIALQSVSAVIDSHQLHQSGEEHLSFEHDHDKPTTDQIPDSKPMIKSLENSPYDCHHCCHCHGTSTLYVSGFNCNFQLVVYEKKTFEYLLNLPSTILFPAFRPPIV